MYYLYGREGGRGRKKTTKVLVLVLVGVGFATTTTTNNMEFPTYKLGIPPHKRLTATQVQYSI